MSRDKYHRLIERIFLKFYKPGDTIVEFEREEIATVASELEIPVPKNLGDLLYSYRYRRDLPDAIVSKAPPGKMWQIHTTGRAKYCFEAVEKFELKPREGMAVIKIPDATPGVISKYAQSDEQAVLAKIRYNRLLDIFTGVACYSLQSHYRTSVNNFQIETDELYIGIDRRGAHYVFPVQAKGGRDKMGLVQINQDIALCKARFPQLICRPIAAQAMGDDVMALLEFKETEAGPRVCDERHYRLVEPRSLTDAELAVYKREALAHET